MNLCKNCGLNCNNLFCSKSCSAKYNNKNRKLKQSTKDKIRNSMINYITNNTNKIINKGIKIECIECREYFIRSNKRKILF